MRIFYAITFKENTKDILARYRDTLADHTLKGRFTSKDNIHLTLAFIGEVKHKDLPAYESVLDHISNDYIKLKATHVGSFKKKNKDILWLGLEKSEALARLHKNLTLLLDTYELAYEKRKFHPHITVGRQVVLLDHDLMLPAVELELDSIALMHSHRKNDILTYQPIYEIKFKQP